MQSKFTIKPAGIREISYVTAEMRPQDRAEIYCQFDSLEPDMLARIAVETTPQWKWAVILDGQPVMVFGLSPRHSRMVEAWAWGTDQMKRAVPIATRFMLRHVLPDLIASGIHRIEARSLENHDLAHGWMVQLGGKREAIMHNYGLNRETFHLYAWTKDH